MMKASNENAERVNSDSFPPFVLGKQYDPQFILDALLGSLPTGVTVFGPDLEMIACNAKFRELLDFPESLFASDLPSLPTLLHFDAVREDCGKGNSEDIFTAAIERAKRFEPHVFELTRPNGTILKIRGNPLPGGGFVTIYTDVTEQRSMEHALRVSEEQFRGAFQAAAIGMALVGLDGRWLKVNSALCDMIGYSENELLCRTFQDITHPDDLDADLLQVRKLVANEITYYHMEKRYFHKLGRIVWILLSGSLVRDEQGGPIHFVAQMEDITDRKRSEEQVLHLANYDALTDLPNRRLLQDRLKQAMARAKRFRHSIAVMFLDLDNFKKINDSLGHDFGDALLKVAAERLSSCVRSVDTVSRQGGDEFVIVLSDIAEPQHVVVVAEKILKALSEPIPVREHVLNITVSIGVSIYSGSEPDDSQELMRKADIAMYQAKYSGRNRFQIFVDNERRGAGS